MSRTGGKDGGGLTVEFLEKRRRVTAPGHLVFGRAGDLVVDPANRQLHRHAGRFYHHGGVWWLENLGDHVALGVVVGDGVVSRLAALADDGGPRAVALLAPFQVRFTAGGCDYELAGRPDPGPPALPLVGPCEDPPGTTTEGGARVELTAEERAMLVRLAAPVLRDPWNGPESLPANKALAYELNWSLPKFNRKLDHLCVRLRRAGAVGLHGGRGAEVTNRRWRLVVHAINTRMVTRADLCAE